MLKKVTNFYGQLMLIICFCLVSQISISQIGITAGLKSIKASDWTITDDAFFEEEFVDETGFNIGIDYWFRLKNYRIEFLPQLGYEKFNTNESLYQFDYQSFNISMNVNIYFLDIEGDCNCPTFSKQGNFFQKGFFLQPSIGWSFINSELEYVVFPDLVSKSNTTNNLQIGLGVGLDVGITDFITLTPMYKIYYLPNVSWDGLNNERETTNSDILQPFIGCRIGFRWDN